VAGVIRVPPPTSSRRRQRRSLRANYTAHLFKMLKVLLVSRSNSPSLQTNKQRLRFQHGFELNPFIYMMDYISVNSS
jgi:hypothetical protein